MAVAFGQVVASSGATSTSLVLTKPSGLAVGELMIAYFAQGTGVVAGDDVSSAPSGWAASQKVFSTEGEMLFWSWKIADSADVAASTFTWTMTASHVYHGVIARYTGNHTSAPFPTSAHYSLKTDTAGTTHATNSITPTVDNCLICAFFMMGSGSATWTLDGTLTSRYNASLQSLPEALGDVAQTTAAAVSKSSTSSSGQTTGMLILAIAPDTGGGGAPPTTDPTTFAGLWDDQLLAEGWF